MRNEILNKRITASLTPSFTASLIDRDNDFSFLCPACQGTGVNRSGGSHGGGTCDLCNGTRCVLPGQQKKKWWQI